MPTIDSKNRRIRYNILIWGPCPAATGAGIQSLYDTVAYGKRSTLQVIETWGGPTLCFEYEPVDAGVLIKYLLEEKEARGEVNYHQFSPKNLKECDASLREAYVIRVMNLLDIIYFDRGNYSRIHEYDVNGRFSNGGHLEIESENTILFE